MSLYDLVQLFITFLLVLVPWVFPDFEWYIKVIIVLSALIVSMIVLIFRVLYRNEKTKKQLERVKRNHQALSERFNAKLKLENSYNIAFEHLNRILHLAMQNKKEAKLDDIYAAFIIAQRGISEGD